MDGDIELPDAERNGSRGFFWMLLVSAFCHLMFFTVVIFARDLIPEPPPPDFSSVISVTIETGLPEIPVEEPARETPAVKEVPEPIPTTPEVVKEDTKPTEPEKPEVIELDEPEPVVSISEKKAPPEKKEKTEKKPEPEKPKKRFKPKFRKDPKKSVAKPEDFRPKPVSEAIRKIRDQIAKGETGTNTGPVGVPGNGSKIAGARIVNILDVYKASVGYEIENHWAYPERLIGKGSRMLFADINVRVLPDGTIQKFWFVRKSGNAFFDESAKRAVEKTTRVAPHPKEVKEPYLDIGFTFKTPERN